jgi:cob(I)alamin adenosyltransferase
MLGLVHVYTGDGKGKTTSAIGTGIRAVGHGYKVHMIQFMKGGEKFPQYGEIISLKNVPNFTVEQYPTEHFVQGKTSEKDKETINKALARAREVTSSGEFDLVILDEINVACHFGLIKVSDVVDLISSKAPHTELILTGRKAPYEVIEKADLVSNIENIKHPFDRGVKARKGVEF